MSGLTVVFAQLDRPNPVDTPDIAWFSLLPLLVLTVGAVLLVLLSSLMKERLFRGFHAAFTCVTAGAAIGTAVYVWNRIHDEGPSAAIAGAVAVDRFAVFLTVVICASVILAALVSEAYLCREDLDGPEYYVLMLLSAAGGVVMALANDLIVVFLGLEILSIAAYVMAAMQRHRTESQEAGLKYFVLGAFSSAFFLYGIAMVYGATGSTNLSRIATFLAENVLLSDGVLLLGLVLLLVGLGFKVAAVPFHSWSPDVYQGAPSPAVSYLASAVKVAAFGSLLRIFVTVFQQWEVDWQPIVYALAVASLVVGAVLAAVQTDVKRMMAYSSINHAGFILLGVQASSDDGTAAALFYLAAYAAIIAGTFGIITIVSGRRDRLTSVDDFAGLGRRRPALALGFCVLLFAQAGVPFTSGFFAKFGVIVAAVDARSYWLAVVAMVTAVVSAFVYLRVVVAMYMADDPEAEGDGDAAPRAKEELPFTAGLGVGLSVAITLVVGVLPWLVTEVAKDAVPVLVAVGG
ncbi:MAG TPA: NADH-quinone oxidoreductase subunit N [Acidimicrobiales bacterium]|nr:NADH-quinone oxidoreductase subunit N [Acidimicrobiales bacterium]